MSKLPSPVICLVCAWLIAARKKVLSLRLLGQEEQLHWYLRRGRDCVPITRVSDGYPLLLRKKLGAEAPGCLWAKGDIALLERPAVALVGSRALQPENAAFARKVGQEAAKQGYVLVSGNAKGADITAQEACLKAGGQVISIVADSLQKQQLRENILYLSLDDFDQDFSAQRALHRNHVIHTMAALTIAAQCTLGKGGTWDGILANLKCGWNPVCIFADGSEAAADLQNRGVQTVTAKDLQDLPELAAQNPNFFNG